MRSIFGSIGLVVICVLPMPALAERMIQQAAVTAEIQILLPKLTVAGSYGLFLRAPKEEGCDQRRYVVVDSDQKKIGISTVLSAGQGAVVRLRRADVLGDQPLTIRTLGCGNQPEAMRVVRLAKPSPDLGSSTTASRSGARNVRVASLALAAEEEPALETARGLDNPLTVVARVLITPPQVEDRRRQKGHRRHAGNPRAAPG